MHRPTSETLAPTLGYWFGEARQMFWVGGGPNLF